MHFRNKTVLLIIHQGHLGGAERQGLGISKILTAKYNCEVNVLLTHSDVMSDEFRSYANECRINKILFFGKSYLLLKREFSYRNFKRLVWSLKYLNKLRRELKPYKPDVIIPFLNFPSKLSFYLFKIVPSVKYTFWHQLGLDSLSKDLFEYFAVKNIPFVIANAENGLDMFREDYIIDSEKLNVLPQYISFNMERKNRSEVLKYLSIDEKSIVIGMIAHYRPEKLHFLLLESFIELLPKNDNICLLFLGNKQNSPKTKQTYENLIKNVSTRNLENKVKVLSGEKVDVVLSVIDIGVLVSKIEGVPNAVMEYMLYGIPVIASDHVGCKELLNNSEFLIKNEKNELMTKLSTLISSKKLRESEGIRNSLSIKRYTMESYIEKLELIGNKYYK